MIFPIGNESTTEDRAMLLDCSMQEDAVMTQVVSLEEDLYKTANILNGIKEGVVSHTPPSMTPMCSFNCTLDLGLKVKTYQ
jgi:hypothetical protein